MEQAATEHRIWPRPATTETGNALAKEGTQLQWEIDWRIVAITAAQCGLDPATVTPASRLIEDLGIDSLELVELVLALEEEFNVTIPDAAVGEVFTRSPVTLRDMALLVGACWGTGKAAREEWRHARLSSPAAEEMPFTQFGGRLDASGWMNGPLYEAMGPNREGYFQYRRRTDGIRCVLIPASQSLMGSDRPNTQPDQRPPHSIHLSEFLMDAEPVSNAAYARFLNFVSDVPANTVADWCNVSKSDKRRFQFPLRRRRHRWEPLPGTERQPMILVSWYGANAYSLWAHRCDWRYYRGDGTVPAGLERLDQKTKMPPSDWLFSHLPSEAQWEYAARGGEKAPAPLGAGGVVGTHAIGNTYTADTLPSVSVNERRGMSLFGLHHMGGNVWQWCRDWYAPDFYERAQALLLNPQNTEPTGIRSERGGSWVGPAELAQPWHRRGRPPEARGRCLGFRCVGQAGR